MEEKKLENPIDKKYEKIAFTALGVAQARTFSDIPYSKEIYDELKRLSVSGTDPEGLVKIADSVVPMFEARFKLDNRLLRTNNAEQILEVASGFSPRGLDFAKDEKMKYVEVDIPDILLAKEKISKSINDLPNLHFATGDALDLQSLENALADFNPNKPVAVVNEGLMRYFNFDQKTQYAKNVKAILERFGGVWITPDITLAQPLNKETDIKKNAQIIKEKSGIDIQRDNTFESVEQAKVFFEDLGFDIESHSWLEISDQLVSPERVGVSKEAAIDMIKEWVVFVMRLKK